MSSNHDRRITAGDRIIVILYRCFSALLGLVSIRVVALFGRILGYLVWMLMPSRRRIVARNLRIVENPMLRGPQLRSMVRENIVRTCMNMACTFKTGMLTDAELKRAVTVVGADSFEEKASDGNSVIGCVPHAGNWEILARIRPYFPKVKRYGSMYRRLDNPALEQIVLEGRTRYGCEMFSNKKGLKEVFRLVGEGGMLGVLSDQFTQQGIFVPYFGKVTGTTPLPSLIQKRSKGRASLYAVGNRSIGLGRWEADLGHEIPLPGNEAGLPTLTHAVNQALEEVQKKSILDGFWMHHRWKATKYIAGNTSEEQFDIIRAHARLPFRIIVCVPEAFEEALLAIPMMRRFQACRPDMQLTVLCPSEQKAFWQTQPYITYVVTTDEPVSPAAQLEADDLYKDGPYDYLIMLSDNARILRNINKLGPLYISGSGTNPLARKFSGRAIPRVGQAPRHKSELYQDIVARHLGDTRAVYADTTLGNNTASGLFIAPFSTLGSADSWTTEKWQQLISLLPATPRLLALESDRAAAEDLSKTLGISTCIVQPETVAQELGPQCRLYAVDGLLPQLAALVGCPCHVLMASRLAAVYAPLGEGHHTVCNHTPCHPCYRSECDQATSCTSGVTAQELLG